jgi:transposase
MAKSFAGIDVSKDKLDVHILPAGLAASFHNSAAGIVELVQLFQGHSQEGLRVVLESTGGMELAAALACEEAGFETAIVRPDRIIHFAKANARKAKTDALDARLIARFASTIEIEIYPLPSKEIRELRELIDRRSQLIGMRLEEQNRLRSTHLPMARKNIEEHIQWIGENEARVEKEIAARIAANPTWKRLDEVIQSVPGYGPQSSHALIGQLPELGQVESKRLAHLVGVAPLAKDSGSTNQPRHIVGGRKQLRNTLYMATVAAIRFNPVAKEFYTRLRQAGKAPKVALIGVARKLLCILNAMVKSDSLWRDLKPAT